MFFGSFYPKISCTTGIFVGISNQSYCRFWSGVHHRELALVVHLNGLIFILRDWFFWFGPILRAVSDSWIWVFGFCPFLIFFWTSSDGIPGYWNLSDRQEGKLWLESKFWLESVYLFMLTLIKSFCIAFRRWKKGKQGCALSEFTFIESSADHPRIRVDDIHPRYNLGISRVC